MPNFSELNIDPKSDFRIAFSLLDRGAAAKIVTWRYAPPYDIYNLDETEEEIAYAVDPKNNFYMMHDSQHELVGFCSFGEDGQVPGGDYSQEALDIGMGIRPDLTGQGYGSLFAAAVLQFAYKTFQPPAFRVTIAAFNQRARRVWEKNGFQQSQTFTQKDRNQDFIVMIRNVDLSVTGRMMKTI